MFTLNQNVIVVKRHQRPEIATITHVTKTGQFKTDVTGDKRYRVLCGGSRCQCIGKYGHMSAEEIDVHPHSSDKMAELIADFERREAECKADREKRDAKRDAQRRQHEERLEIVRVMFPKDAINKAQIPSLPDGSRIYQFTLNSTNGTDGRSWVWLLVMCADVIDRDWNVASGKMVNKQVVRMTMTYRVGSSRGGFPSMGTSDYATDEDAVYEALAYAQFMAW